MSSSTRGIHNMYSQSSTDWSILRNEEFQEDDIWGTLHQIQEIDSIFSNGYSIKSSSLIPKSRKQIKSLDQSEKVKQSSASLTTPNWIKTGVKKESNTIVSWSGKSNDHYQSGIVNAKSWDSDEEEDDNGGMMVPPHEWIARKFSRSGMSSFSVHEGVGRTLKGRDLSNVRNAVLSKTGFIE